MKLKVCWAVGFLLILALVSRLLSQTTQATTQISVVTTVLDGGGNVLSTSSQAVAVPTSQPSGGGEGPTPPIVPGGVAINITNSSQAILYPNVGICANVTDALAPGGLTVDQLRQANATIGAKHGINWNWGDPSGVENATEGWASYHDYASAGTYTLTVSVPLFNSVTTRQIVIVPDNRPTLAPTLAPASNAILDLKGGAINFTTLAADLSGLSNLVIQNGTIYCQSTSAQFAFKCNASTISPTFRNLTFDGIAGNSVNVWEAQGSGGSSWINCVAKNIGGSVWCNQLDYSGCYLRGCSSAVPNGIGQYFVWNSGRNLGIVDCTSMGCLNQWQIRSEYNGSATNITSVAVIGGKYTLSLPQTNRGNIRFMSGKFYTVCGVTTVGPTSGATVPVEPGIQTDAGYSISDLLIANCNLNGNFIRVRPSPATNSSPSTAQNIVIVNSRFALDPTLNTQANGYPYPSTAISFDSSKGAIGNVTVAGNTLTSPPGSGCNTITSASPGVTNMIFNGAALASPFVGTLP